MKKLIAITTMLAMILAFTGCGSSNAADEPVSGGEISIFAESAEKTGSSYGTETGSYSTTVAAKADTIGGEYDSRIEGASGDTAAGGAFEDGSAAIDGFGDVIEGAVAADADEGADMCYGDDIVIDGDFLIDDDISVIDPECELPPYVQPQSGLLTGGEWCDNDNWSFWNNLYQNQSDWNSYKAAWNITKINRIEVKVVTDNDVPLENAVVRFNGWTARTDNKGRAYVFYEYGTDAAALDITAAYGGETKQVKADSDNITIGFSGAAKNEKSLDLMFVVDTTGSMSDELSYLQKELENVVRTVEQSNANLPTRVSVNFYRDEGDEYVVRPFDFTSDLSKAVNDIGAQWSDGGGDYEEAVEQALDNAINQHDWAENSTKIMFMVLDAPPHNTAEIAAKMNTLTQQAAEKGIRIVPVASSGVDKNTEYLLRCLSIYTGGTYTFLTDDSGIGESHLEPTVGDYTVEKLNDMLIRIINSYLA